MLVWNILWNDTVGLAQRGETARVRANLEKLIETAPSDTQREQARRILTNLPVAAGPGK